MKDRWIECVANFSEGRDSAKVGAILRAILSGRDVQLLHQTMDPDHHRSVISFIGTSETVGDAALRGIGQAVALIDLNHHAGAHPRIGAADVVPFVPLFPEGVETARQIAAWVGKEAARRFGVPVYLYEWSARRPERRSLEAVRRGQFEGLREAVGTDASRRPDFGEARLHPTAGAIAIGARGPLIAFNVDLETPDLEIARCIARKVRESAGGLPCVKALGLYLPSRGRAQVAMNLTNFEMTSLPAAFAAVHKEAQNAGVRVVESELVGLAPRAALNVEMAREICLASYSPGMILENQLERVLGISCRGFRVGMAEHFPAFGNCEKINGLSQSRQDAK
jgi:glutamate formiminotransferase / formiminotetrahydrofolate cyclodeaminase